jgi:outer membrane lipoprotein SlyB
METTRSPLHPLLTVAAISVTVLCAAGVAALTGMIPQSAGSSQAAIIEAPQVSPPAPVTAPIPAPQPAVKKAVVRRAPTPAEPAVYREFGDPVVLTQAPAATPAAPAIEVAKPTAQIGVLGVVQEVQEVKEPGESKGAGVIAGGLAGGIVGNKIAGGGSNTRKVMTLLGVAGGAWAGNQIEKQTRATKHWELTVRLDDGSTQKIRSESEPFWHAGDRVRMVDGKLQPS